MPRLIFHIDVNSAFLSWEAVFRLRYLHETLDIRTIPSAVGGDRESRRGIILASSIPAKKLGVRTPEPIVDALRKCPELLLVEPRSDFYRECSHAFISIISEYTDIIEQVSIDEAFAEFTEVHDAVINPRGFADMLRNRIRDELGFTVNIGISENKLLAKMASDFTKPDRTHTLFPAEVPSKMWPLPVGDLMFVGRSSVEKLRNLGIHTIGQLASFNPELLSRHFGKMSSGMIASANGIDFSPVTTEHADPKGYSHSTTMPENLTNREDALKVLLSLCDAVGARLRRDKVYIRVLAVSIRDSSFRKWSHQATLDAATNITNELYEHACRLFDMAWDGSPIRALGVHTSGVCEEEQRQYSLFDTRDYSRESKADATMDELRRKFGKDCVTRASLIEPAKKVK